MVKVVATGEDFFTCNYGDIVVSNMLFNQHSGLQKELEGGSVGVGTLEELLKDYVKPDYSKAAQEIADGSKNYGESFFWNKMFQCVFPVMEGAWDIALGQQKSNLVKGGGIKNFIAW